MFKSLTISVLKCLQMFTNLTLNFFLCVSWFHSQQRSFPGTIYHFSLDHINEKIIIKVGMEKERRKRG